ncbi:MAG: hypothetical protein ACOYOB_15175, partial [Myxococcota bacterium]
MADLHKPAFLQYSVGAGTFDGWPDGDEKVARTPDEIDVADNGRSHDIKAATVTQPRLEHWIYALVTLQGLAHYNVQYDGSARLFASNGDRVNCTYAPGRDWSSRFRRDVSVALSKIDELAYLLGLSTGGGQPLAWTLGRDNAPSFRALHPMFIEAPRCVRFVRSDDSTVAMRARPGHLKFAEGAVLCRDLWQPTKTKKAKGEVACYGTTASDGFGYGVLKDLLFCTGSVTSGALAVDERRPGDRFFVASVLRRDPGDKGKSKGYAEAWIEIPERFNRHSEPDLWAAALRCGEQRVQAAAVARDDVLAPALRKLQQAGKEKTMYDAKPVAPWLALLDEAVHAEFFAALWCAVDLDPDTAQATWGRWLFEQ